MFEIGTLRTRTPMLFPVPRVRSRLSVADVIETGLAAITSSYGFPQIAYAVDIPRVVEAVNGF
jgi:hypothetical protein